MAAPACLMAVFGGTSDLCRRLLLPAIYNLAATGLLPERFALVGLSRKTISDDEYRAWAGSAIRELHASCPPDDATLEQLLRRLYHRAIRAEDGPSYRKLREALDDLAQADGIGDSILFYLAVPPSLFALIPRFLAEHGLLAESGPAFRRVVFEKPFGHSLESARELNEKLNNLMAEDQIYRIDHYLGKETVQNIMVTRFANGIWEPLWNRRYIESVHIRADESIGIGSRAGYYDQAGALRDMVPNHLLSLTSLVAMEPPSSLKADDVRDEKLKVLRAIVRDSAVRGQYDGYLGEPGVGPGSRTETFVALRLHINNWRWSGVPFYLRTGKRLAERCTEVAIRFKPAPGCTSANQLLLRIQPAEEIKLSFSAKVPGPGLQLQEVSMDFDYEAAFGRCAQTGYETLVYDAMRGDATLFQRADETEAAWRVIDPLLAEWARDPRPPRIYPQGSSGPEELPPEVRAA
jgi:glucose-6-phosphate 1-dehydrogenase